MSKNGQNKNSKNTFVCGHELPVCIKENHIDYKRKENRIYESITNNRPGTKNRN